jgi:hypothetical protein
MTADIGNYGEDLYQQTLPLHGPDPDGLAHDYVGAVTHPLRQIDEIVRDTPEGPGWSILLDVAAAPVEGLPWLAQVLGVELAPRSPNQTDEEWEAYARDALRRQTGRQRGTIDAIVSAIQATLTGTRSVSIVERYAGDPYQITYGTRSSETPDPDATYRAMLRQKPAGIIATHVETADWAWIDVAADYATWADFTAAFPTWTAAGHHTT